jgi:hypothetical protein
LIGSDFSCREHIRAEEQHSVGMHQIFQIDELAREITRNMVVWGVPHHSALDWALTCKTISDPALDVLWEVQDGLVNLLKTLPSDVWETNRNKLVSDFITRISPD